MNPTNYTQQIREQLEAGKRVSVISILNTVGTIDARKYISDLRNKEHLPIKSVRVKSLNGKYYNEYFLDKDAA